MKKIIQGVITVLLLASSGIAILIAANVVYSSKAESPLKDSCADYADPVRVKVGDTEFHIPANFKPIFFDKVGFAGQLLKKAPTPQKFSTAGKGDQLDEGYCQHPNDAPFDVPQGFSAEIPQRIRTGPLSSDRLNFTILPMGKGPMATYCELSANAKATGKTLKAIPTFVTYEDKQVNWSIYYSDRITLFGNPIVIYCDNKILNANSGRVCNLAAPLSNTIMLRYLSFYEKNIPFTKWADFVHGYEIILQQIMDAPSQVLENFCH